jgi:hypothetical protein
MAICSQVNNEDDMKMFSADTLPARYISEQDVYQYFGSVYGGRGNVYQKQGRVLSVAVSDGNRTIWGMVQGSTLQPYNVVVRLTNNLGTILSTQCSCPMGGFCKHSAALIFAILRHQKTSRQGQLAVIHNGVPRFSVIKRPDESKQTDHFEVPSVHRDFCLAPMPGTTSIIRSEAEKLDQLSTRTTDWLTCLKQNMQTTQTPPAQSEVGQIIYILDRLDNTARLVLDRVVITERLKGGEDFEAVRETDLSKLVRTPAPHMTHADIAIASLFTNGARNSSWPSPGEFPSAPELTKTILEQMLATGRCFWQAYSDVPLSRTAEETAGLDWKVNKDGSQALCVVPATEDARTVFSGSSAWYINSARKTMGALRLPVSAEALTTIMNAPAVKPLEVELFTRSLIELGLPIPPPREFPSQITDLLPLVRLSFTTIDLKFFDHRPFINYGYSHDSHVPVACLTFDYGNDVFKPGQNEIRHFADNKIEIRKRNIHFEAHSWKQLGEVGLILGIPQRPDIVFFPAERNSQWYEFARETLPALESAGWHISYSGSFPNRVVFPEEEWDVRATQGASFWFSMRLDITVDGVKYPLLPIIQKALSSVGSANAVTDIEVLNINGFFYAPLPDGRSVALEFERVRVIIETLIELFDKDYKFKKGKVKVSLPQVMALVLLPGLRWNVPERLQELLRKLREFSGPKSMTPPASFRAQLRPYQCEGLAWLDFIRDLGIGGILADDMGLGKTVQTLAHIAIEKENKRATKPFLVICPTSVLPNWLSEIERFTPSMKVTVLWGPYRSSHFDKIESSDIVVTTYPLIVRDQDILMSCNWQAVFLDEAQMVKNPDTLAAKAIRSLTADYRFCLTGTPVENHLGELWAQFDFLMPGFLADAKSFKKHFRGPIEKGKDSLVQKALARRIKPFLLRRTKEIVADDLPEKSTITRTIELEGDQRDLYETVRVAMYEKVQQALLCRGIAKSQIIVLDALLKLRQVCCHPQLVSFPAAQKVRTSSKLEALMQMIDELLSAGRKVLLFSQFTSMLDLIVPKLEEKGIAFVELRGDTKDRLTPVRNFQEGKVPLFLLSLRAGGLGLNLTAADTVIHYDPWWNPAVENQATDRAHRIGQKKNVFVFRMIASGTIEERMLELQERKRAIAAGIYTDQSDSFVTSLSEDEIESLFQPLPPEAPQTPMAAARKSGWWEDVC